MVISFAIQMSKLLHTRDSSYASQLASPGSMEASRGEYLVWPAVQFSRSSLSSRAAAVARVCIPLCIGPGILYHWSGSGGRLD